MFAKVMVALLFLGLKIANAADISVYPSKNPPGGQDLCSYNTITLNGEITKGDSAKLSNSIRQVQKKYSQVECMGGVLPIQLNSTGGDVEEAIKLGRIIRQNEMRVIVPVNAKCHSACVLVIAGGVERSALGKVGVHRPYFVSLDSRASQSEVKAQRDAMSSKIKAYLNEMDVSNNLLEMMLSVPPEAVKILTEGELQQLRLSIKDAAFDERQVAAQAYLYGLNSSDYRKRDMLADRQSPMTNASGKFNADWSVCRLAILLNISKSAAIKLDELSEQCDQIKSDSESRECYRKIFISRH